LTDRKIKRLYHRVHKTRKNSADGASPKSLGRHRIPKKVFRPPGRRTRKLLVLSSEKGHVTRAERKKKAGAARGGGMLESRIGAENGTGKESKKRKKRSRIKGYLNKRKINEGAKKGTRKGEKKER